MKLNLGCGNVHKEGFINIDSEKTSAADQIVDLNRYPWPFPSNSIDVVYCSHFLEHVDEPVKAIEEIYRILKKNGGLEVIAPYYASPGAFYDLTHRSFFGYKTFDPFSDNREYNYISKARFRIGKRKLVFSKTHHVLGVQAFANAFPRIYEDFMAMVFPAREIHFFMEAVK
ncbi:class I SAM-dependent methyltransferase [Candidatus Micrarchaeota archaeon]|nr:class I SAM-dependent methyltransferase [Candidatus Micrarchaeota archaeon]